MTAATVQVTDSQDLEDAVRQAAGVLRSGGLVVFPTETVYGIGASAASSQAVAALRGFKQRDVGQPFTVHLGSPSEAQRYIDLSQPRLARLLRKVLPGPVTLVVDVDPEVVEAKSRKVNLPGEVIGLIWHEGAVGLRCPDDETARRILSSVDVPVLASSANRRGQRPPLDARQAAEAVADAADLIVDGGRCRYAKPSTIIRVHAGQADPPVTVARAGVFDRRYVKKLLRWTMLLVCSGNTCRSPMAEAIAKQILAQRRGIEPDELEPAGLYVLSAGAYAAEDTAPSAEAVTALAARGIDLSRHHARRLTADMIRQADVIYCMTNAHVRAVVDMMPSAADKTFLLDPAGDIEDPIGAGPSIYQRCAELMHRRLEQRLKEQQV